MSERLDDALRIVYTDACVRFLNKVHKVAEAYPTDDQRQWVINQCIEKKFLGAFEEMYPDIVEAIRAELPGK